MGGLQLTGHPLAGRGDDRVSAAGGREQLDLARLDGVVGAVRLLGHRLDEFDDVRTVRGRNTTILLRRASGDGIVVKQHRQRRDCRYAAEVRVHEEVLVDPVFLGQPVATPRLVSADPANRLLAFELVADAEDLGARLARRPRLSRRVLRDLGTFLGTLHTHGRADAMSAPSTDAARADDLRQMPRLDEIDARTYADLSEGQCRLVSVVQRDDALRQRLNGLVDTVVPTSRVHGDLRPENVLVGRDGGERRPVLIDWELARTGDPAVELGQFVGCVLDRVLNRVVARSSAEWRAVAGDRVRASLREMASLWAGYHGAGRVLVEQRPMLPLLVSAHAAGTLVAHVFHRAGDTGTVTGRDWLIVQLARAVLLEPTRHCRELVGDKDVRGELR